VQQATAAAGTSSCIQARGIQTITAAQASTSGSSKSWPGSLAAVAAAALAATGSLLTTTALAEARAGDGSKGSKASSGSGGSSPGGDALVVAQQALQAAWAEVSDDMTRMNARLPANAQQLRGSPPKVSLTVDGALEVSIPVRAGASADAVLTELVSAFSPAPGSPASTSMRSQRMGTSSTVLLEVATPRSHAAEGGGTSLRAQLYMPSASAVETAEVTVTKRALGGGPAPAFTQQELAGLVSVLRAANLTQGSGAAAEAWPPGSSIRRHGFGPGPEDLETLVRQMEAEVLGPLFGGMVMGGFRDMLDAMARQGGAGDLDDEGAEGGSGVFPYPGGAGRMGSPQGYQPGQRGGGKDGGAGDGHDWGSPQATQAVKQLQGMGAQVYPPGKKENMDWGVLAGYEDQKRQVEDCLLLPLQRPDVYAQLAQSTRATPNSTNRPRAVLFEGPPGTGKTTSARVISTQAAVPLIYVPLEAVLSKWYGESEGLLAKVFKAAEALGGAIIFFDELDSLGGSRERGDLHEASRRLLSVLLREMDGFDAAGKRAVVIGATNRKEDLDPALLSRFDMSVMFGLPDARVRALILGQYARQLAAPDLAALAARTPGCSGRDLKDVCEHTERRWASKIIRGEVAEGTLPPLPEYLASAAERLATIKQTRSGNGLFGL